jgi:aryl-alcohol dehydrogenase-like predicted oxidoreductase
VLVIRVRRLHDARVDKRRLGKTDIEVTPVGLGCWQFSGGSGPSSFWGEIEASVVDGIVKASLDGGIDWFDTAEIYGRGRSERGLSRALRLAGKNDGDVRIATKWWPVARRASSIGRTIEERIACLSPYSIDLHQVHNPLAFASVRAQMKEMADLVLAKKIRAVGVSNFSARRMIAAHEALASHGLPLATNQVKWSLAHRKVEKNGVLAAAKRLGITIIAYSPLQQGLLTGKFHDDPALIASRHGPRKLFATFRGRGLKKSRPLVDELRAIANAHGATPAQVALAWLLQFHGDGVLVIPGATKDHHVKDNVGSMGLRLTPKELDALDQRSRVYL